MSKIEVFDLLNYEEDKDIKKVIGNEKIYYTDYVTKINN